MLKTSSEKGMALRSMAVRVGFEPTEPVKAQRFSRPPDSTTLAPHHVLSFEQISKFRHGCTDGCTCTSIWKDLQKDLLTTPPPRKQGNSSLRSACGQTVQSNRSIALPVPSFQVHRLGFIGSLGRLGQRVEVG